MSRNLGVRLLNGVHAEVDEQPPHGLILHAVRRDVGDSCHQAMLGAWIVIAAECMVFTPQPCCAYCQAVLFSFYVPLDDHECCFRVLIHVRQLVAQCAM